MIKQPSRLLSADWPTSVIRKQQMKASLCDSHASRMTWLVTGFLLGFVAFGLFPVWASHPKNPIDAIFRKLEVLAEVVAAIEQHYVATVSPSKLVYGAARGAVASLDGYSAFCNPQEYHELQNVTEGEFVGVGIEIRMREHAAEIISVFEDTPADRAGIESMDFLTGINGNSIEGWPMDAVTQALLGPVGTSVTLQIVKPHRETPWDYHLVRKWIRVTPLKTHALPHGMVHTEITTFSRRLTQDLQKALNAHAPISGLILDLRGNAGGLFDEAVAMCDLFLTDGPMVLATGKGGQVLQQHVARKQHTQPAYPLAVLVDGSTASASEIVAGALQDRGRAKIFGQKTYGKASVQTMMELSDGSGLKLTIAHYHTPSGRPIEGQGILPDVLVDAPKNDSADQNHVAEKSTKRDPVLQAARHWLASQISSKGD